LGKGDVNISKISLPEDRLPIIEVSNVRKTSVPGSLEILVLLDVNLKIERGVFLAIMGPSGSGKSTLVNLTDCLYRPTEGQVLLRGKDLNRMSDQELARLRGLEIGFVFQTFNLFPRLTALGNVFLPIFAIREPVLTPGGVQGNSSRLWGCINVYIIDQENFQEGNLRGSHCTCAY
jgi:putative ABC transport system ATP-binding protein